MNGDDKETDFLDQMKTQAETAPPEESEDETAEEVEETADDTGEKQAPAEVTPPAKVEATPAPAAEKETVPLAALMAEREKRKDYEKELERYRAQEREQAQKPVDFYQNPEQHIAEVVTQVEQRANNRMYAALEAEARAQFADYDEVFAEVEAYAQGNPAAVQQVFSAPNPARAAYELGKRIREFKEMQNPETYRAKLEAELRAKLEAEQVEKTKQAEAEAAAKAQKLADIPPDISKTASAVAETRQRKSPVFNQLFDKKPA